jgi:hypothetical protein
MSLYQKASLVQIPSGYKAADDKLYSVVPSNGDGDFTVTVAADATRVNKDGLIESVVADQARLNYDPTNPQDPHLLLEPSRTNLTQRSEQFDNSYWTKARSSITANQTTSPDGSNTADKLIDSTDNNTHILYRSLTVSTSNAYTFSCFLKKGSLSKAFLAFDAAIGQTVIFDLENGTVESEGASVTSSSIVEYPNGWYKCSFTHTPTTTTRLYRIGTYNGSISYTGTGTDFVYLWGAQLEQGSYPTSYIPTTTAQVTRTADDVYQTTTFDLSTNNEYSFYIDVEGTNFTSDFQYLLKIQNKSGGYGFKLQAYSFGGNEYVRMFANYGGGSQSTITPYGNTDIPFYDRNRIAVSLRSDGYSTYLNGVKLTNQSASTSVNWDSVNEVDFNSTSSGASVYGRKTYELMVFNTALTDSELQTLTS